MQHAQPTSLTFLGAAGTVTGSKYLLSVGERRVLVDAGLFQGEKKWRQQNWAAFPVDPSAITDLLVTHAHLDHCGYIPALVKRGFEGAVWATEETVALAEIVLRDSANLQERDAEDAKAGGWSKHNPPLPLYTEADVEDTLPLFRTVDFDTDTELGGGIRVRYTRAGHILGSAQINVWVDGVAVLFSGDLGRHDHPVLKPRATPQAADYVLLESTYGDREHPESEGLPHELMARTIRRTVERGGSVLIPAFAVDRTEAILKVLTEMAKQGRIPEVPVVVNSPMALAALDVYRNSDELRDDLRPEDFADLKNLREVRNAEDSKKLTREKQPPSIIISSSGMATGGRVVHHLAAMLPDRKNSVILCGYQGVGTRGRLLLEGVDKLKMHGKYVPVRAQIVQDTEFSVHADCSDLLDWVRDLPAKPKTIFLVHGEPTAAAVLGKRIEAEFGIDTIVPRYQEVVALQPGAAGIAEPVVAGPVGGGARRPVPVDRPLERAAADSVQGVAGPPVAVGEQVPGTVIATSSAVNATTAALPAGKLRYRVLTGPDDAAFCQRVSEALEEGYVLYGGPAVTFEGERVIVAQAVVWPGAHPTTAPPVSPATAMPPFAAGRSAGQARGRRRDRE